MKDKQTGKPLSPRAKKAMGGKAGKIAAGPEQGKKQPGLTAQLEVAASEAATDMRAGFKHIKEDIAHALDDEARRDTLSDKMAGLLAAASKQFRPGQIFTMPRPRAMLFILLGCLCVQIQALSMNMFQNNLPQMEAYFQATTMESMWFIGAYMAPYISFVVLFIKVRTHVGSRPFIFSSLAGFIACCVVSSYVSTYEATLVMRFLSGVTTAPITAIGISYTVEPFVPERKVTIGMSLVMMYISLGTPLTRIVVPVLVLDSQVAHFYIFMAALAAIAMAWVYFLKLAPTPKEKVLEPLDFISLPLYGLGVGLAAAMMPVGKFYWWTSAHWMGFVFAIAIFCLTCSILIELNRSKPIFDFRWLFSPGMLHVILIMLVFRLLVSDQVSMINMYYSFLGLQNEQLFTLYFFIALGTLAGGAVCCLCLKPNGGDFLYILGCVAIAIGSFTDSFSTNATRPVDMYFSQMLIGFGMAIFMAVSFSKGILAAVANGAGQYLTSFAGMFLLSQVGGGLSGTAIFGTVQIYLEKFHSYFLTQNLVLNDSQVATRIAAYGQTYSGVTTDSAIVQGGGLSMLNNKSNIEANILAYNDIFRLYSWLAAALFCVLTVRLFMKIWLARRLALEEAAAAAGPSPQAAG
ncbi:MAG: MFS transporter [Candidatus Tokpelaia sp.]|nr:MAG: MFS transporter [Candidatus Tokpelaia sp.]KAA6206286.1 MAG: MFS transporter [Candidatus Tokpelaia sp.]